MVYSFSFRIMLTLIPHLLEKLDLTVPLKRLLSVISFKFILLKYPHFKFHRCFALYLLHITLWWPQDGLNCVFELTSYIQCHYLTYSFCEKYRNFLVWKLCGNCAFPQNFDTRKLVEITAFYAVLAIR